MYPEECRNFRLLGHDKSAGWGGGSRIDVTRGHAYVGAVGGSHYTGPEGFTVHDVSDPRKPHKVAEIKAPPGVHMHKLRIVADQYLYVNSERLPKERGKEGRSGFFIYDISKAAEPRQIGFYDMPGRGPHRFGIDHERHLAFFPNDAEGWNKRVIWTMDIRDPLKPEIVSIWGMPEQKAEGKGEFSDRGGIPREISFHGPAVIRGNRMYACFWGGGVAVIDCTDLRNMKLVGNVRWSPPFVGMTHTAWPIGDRPYLAVIDEAHGEEKHWDSQFMWVVDIRHESNPIPVATFFPDREKYINREGRFGAHNILEDIRSEGPWANIVFLSYFNAGLRAVDVSDPLRPIEVGHYVPALPEAQKAIQSNDIGADEFGRLYLIDRGGAGMHIVEYLG